MDLEAAQDLLHEVLLHLAGQEPLLLGAANQVVAVDPVGTYGAYRTILDENLRVGCRVPATLDAVAHFQHQLVLGSTGTLRHRHAATLLTLAGEIDDHIGVLALSHDRDARVAERPFQVIVDADSAQRADVGRLDVGWGFDPVEESNGTLTYERTLGLYVVFDYPF